MDERIVIPKKLSTPLLDKFLVLAEDEDPLSDAPKEALQKTLPELTSNELRAIFSEVRARLKNSQKDFLFLIDIPTLGTLAEGHLPEIYRCIDDKHLRSALVYNIRECKTFQELHSYWKCLQKFREVEKDKSRILEDIVEHGPYTYNTVAVASRFLQKDQLRSLVDLILPMFGPSEIIVLLRRIRIPFNGKWYLKKAVYDKMSTDTQFAVCEKMFSGKKCLQGLESDWRIRHPGQKPPNKQKRKRDHSPKRNKQRLQLKNKISRNTINP